MKKIVSVFITAIMACSIVGCSQNKAGPIHLPEKSIIQSIDVTIGDETENYSDSEWINQCISSITDAQATAKKSVQDTPQVDEYIKINIEGCRALKTKYIK